MKTKSAPEPVLFADLPFRVNIDEAKADSLVQFWVGTAA
jgi:hypothetical protein